MRYVNNFSDLPGQGDVQKCSVWNADENTVRMFEDALRAYVDLFDFGNVPEDLWEPLNEILEQYDILTADNTMSFEEQGILYDSIPDHALEKCTDLLISMRAEELEIRDLQDSW